MKLIVWTSDKKRTKQSCTRILTVTLKQAKMVYCLCEYSRGQSLLQSSILLLAIGDKNDK